MKNKLLIVADLGVLKAYTISRTMENRWRIALMEEVTLEEAHHRVFETVSDMAGRHGEPGVTQGAVPMSEGSNLRLETRRRLVRKIARNAESFIGQEDWGEIWLAAPKEINQQILAEFPQPDRVRIRKNIPRDLTKAGEQDLLDQFLNL